MNITSAILKVKAHKMLFVKKLNVLLFNNVQ